MLSGGAAGPAPSAVQAVPPDPSTGVLVGFLSGTSSLVEQKLLNSVHAQWITSYPGGPSLAEAASTAARDAAIAELSRAPAVRYAEPDSTIHVDATIPDDPAFSKQWGLDNPNDVDIDAPQAWDTTTGSASTIVAVIDSGIDTSHPEFAGRIWTNPSPDTSGPYAGDVNGWNFLDNNADITDDNGHGSHVSGIIAASGNDGIGVAGIDWHARIMPLKFIGADGNGSVDDAVRAIYFAVDHGARVINASWGGNDHVQALTDAISYANSHNVVFVTASGNDGTNNANNRSYPADDRLPNLLSVAAIDQNGALASFSNFGATTVDLAAPGVNIRSTVPGGYATYSGTSMAAPFVTGVVSLLVGLHPEDSASQLVQRILATVKPLPGLQKKVISGGIVDAANAVSDAYYEAHQGLLAPKAGKLKLHRAKVVKIHHVSPATRPHATKATAHSRAEAIPVRLAIG